MERFNRCSWDGWKARYVKEVSADETTIRFYQVIYNNQNELVEVHEKYPVDGEFDISQFETVRDIISRLGLADVREFGLTWEDCESFLSRLGYEMHVEVSKVA